MAVEVIMPRVDMTMERGTIRAWNRAPGEAVRAGETLFVIETDKAAMEIEAPADGVLGEILVAPGVEVPVGTTVGRILARGETPDARAPAPAVAAPAPAPVLAPTAAPAPVTPVVAPPPPVAAADAAPPRPRATPLARRLARQAGIDLGAVAGSGPLGRVGRGDIEAFLDRHARSTPAAPAIAIAAGRPYTLGARIDLTALFSLRARIAPALPGGRPPGLTAMILRVLGGALARHENVGAASGGAIDIALAIARQDGLAMPVLRGLETMRVPDIVRALERPEWPAPADGAPPRLVLVNAGALGLEDFAEPGLAGGAPVLCIGHAGSSDRIARATLAADRATLAPEAAARFLTDLRAMIAAPELAL